MIFRDQVFLLVILVSLASVILNLSVFGRIDASDIYSSSDHVPDSVLDLTINDADFDNDPLNANNKVSDWPHKESNVTIVLDKARGDRFGNQLERLLAIASYAYCRNFNFCVWKGSGQKYLYELGIPTCSDEDSSGIYRFKDMNFGRLHDAITLQKKGLYHYNRIRIDESPLLAFNEIDRLKSCFYNEEFKKIWRDGFNSAPSRGVFKNSSVANEMFFNQKHVTTIAIHIRRGDLRLGKYNDVFAKDHAYIRIIKELTAMVNARGLPKPEFHIFSEDYGTTNWTAYEGVSDNLFMHLAPEVTEGDKSDWPSMVRDYVHFFKADILVSHRTFSGYAGKLRKSPDPVTGLPIHFPLCRYDRGLYGRSCEGLLKSGPTLAYESKAYWDQNLHDVTLHWMKLPDVWKKEAEVLNLNITGYKD